MKQPFVSVVLLNWNGLRHLKVVIESLQHQSYPADRFEILFADNGSSDDSVDFVRTHYPRVKVVCFEKNYGFAEGNNLAVKSAKGEVLAFLNNDTEADANWLDALVQAYLRKPYAMYGSQAYNFAQRQFSANSVTRLTAWGVPMNINVYKRRSDITPGVYPSLYADAAGMLVEKRLFEFLGGFDGDYFAYEEEKDLGWKGWLRGIPSYVVTDSIYYHKGGATLGEHSPKAAYLLWRNGIRNIVKYERTAKLFQTLLLHIVYTLAVYVKIFIPMKRGRLIFPIIRAYANLFVYFPKLKRTREKYRVGRSDAYKRMGEAAVILNLKESLDFARAFIKRRSALR